MNLRNRLALLFAAAVAALLSAGGALLVHQLSSGLNAVLDASLAVRADDLAQKLEPDGAIADFQDSTTAGSTLAASGTLAQVVGPTGRLLESSDVAAGRQLLTPAQVAAARRAPLEVTSMLGDEQIRLHAIPVPGNVDPPVVVVVGTSREVVLTAVERVRTGLWLGGPVAVALGWLGAWTLAGAVLRPVERMRRQAAAISAGDSAARLNVPARRDEIARLGETMNALLGRLQRALEQQRAFVADAGHELRTPLTMLRAELELAGKPGRDRADLQAAVSAAAQDTDRLIRLAEDLLTLARTDDASIGLQREPFDLAGLVTEATAAAAAVGRASGVRIQTRLVRAVVIGDRARLRQVIDNLLDNALRYAPPVTTITVALSLIEDTQRVALRVVDHGQGFPSDFLPHAFDRFTQADPARSNGAGAGLGLAIVASVVQAHCGTVTASNCPGGGGSVAIQLPTAPADSRCES